MGQPFIDLTGQRFGKLTAIQYAGKDDSKFRYRQWECKCDCGGTKVVKYRDLKRGNCRSCGCMMRAGLVAGGMNKRDYGEARFNDLYLSYKRRSKMRSIAFELTKTQFQILTKSNCHYCGQKPAQIIKANHGVNGEYIYNGIDRIDSAIGYIPSNVYPCCKNCNVAKASMRVEEFLSWVERVFRHSIISNR